MGKIDLKDRKLLYYLSENARISHTQLAKKVGLSKSAISYRINRLVKEKIIKHFASVINIGTLDATTFTILLKFNEDIYERKEIIEYFRKHKYTDWIVSLSGQWDMFVEFVVRGFSHFDSIINEIIENFGDMLNSYKVYFSSDTLRVEHLIEDLYKDLRVEILSSKERSHEVYKIDKTDKKILSALSKNSAKSYLGLAEELSLSFDIVRYRMRNLINNGVIIKFFPEIDLSKLGYTEYVYTLKLRNASKDRVREIKKFISENQNVTYAFNDASDFNIVFVCAFNNAEGIDKLSRGLRKSFSNIIDKQEYFIIKEQILFNLFPEGLSE